jgi:hypothetical protein
MNFDPQKFFIGLMDFFSILLPGALLTYLLMGEVGAIVLGDSYAQLVGAQAWAAFLFASYLFGHLLSLLGPRLAEIYDWSWRNSLNEQNQPVTPVVLAPASQRLASGSVGRVAKPEEKFAGERIALIVEYMNRREVPLAGKGEYR